MSEQSVNSEAPDIYNVNIANMTEPVRVQVYRIVLEGCGLGFDDRQLEAYLAEHLEHTFGFEWVCLVNHDGALVREWCQYNFFSIRVNQKRIMVYEPLEPISDTDEDTDEDE